MIRFCCLIPFLLSVLLAGAAAQTSQNTAPAQQPAQEIPVIDGALGPCSLQLTLMDGNARPVYAAKVNVHIAYGFGGFHKLDLEASTNVDGKIRFTGLPARVHNAPLVFHAIKDQLTGFANYDPASECQGKHDIVMKPEQKQAPAGSQ